MFFSRVSATFCLAFLMGCLALPALAQNRESWAVQSVDGDVRHEVGGSASALSVGDRVGIGSKVVTAAGARAVLTRGAESITMSPGSEIVIPAETGNMLTRIVQNIGTLLLKVNKRPDRHFEVATPYLAAVVKGTTFTVSVNAEGGAVHVLEGLVQVDDAQSGQSGLVRPGQTGVVTSRPGGGLQISGGKASGPSKNAAATAKGLEKAAEKTPKDDAAGSAPGNAKAAAAKDNPGRAAAVAEAKAAASKPGPAIGKTIGTIRVDIAAATNGFVHNEASGGKAAGNSKAGLSSDDGSGGNLGGAFPDAGNPGGASPGGGSAGGVVAKSGNSGNGNPGGGTPGNGNPGGGTPGGGNSGGGNSGGGNAGGGNPGNGNLGGGNPGLGSVLGLLPGGGNSGGGN